MASRSRLSEMASANTQPQSSRLVHENAYAPYFPSPLNPNPIQPLSPARHHRIIRRHAKIVSISSTCNSNTSGTTSSSSHSSSARRAPRSVTTTQRLLRRKAEEAVRVHLLYRHIQATAERELRVAQDPSSGHHRAQQQQQQRQHQKPAGTDCGDLGVVMHASFDEKRAVRDEWNLDLEGGRNAIDELDQLERKLGMGWREGDMVAQKQQHAVQETRKRPQKSKVVSMLKRPAKGVLLAVALVCLCGIPALRGQAFSQAVFQKARTLAGSI